MTQTYTAPPPDATAAPNPYLQPTAPINTSPGLALALGLIPGVGAIYNGQYLKGLVHAAIFGLLISLSSSSAGGVGEPILVMMCVGFYAYMMFEAYHTAKKRQAGLPVDEWSSLIAPNRYMSRAPIGPILVIVLGVLFLLDNLQLIEFRQVARFWPVLLIVAGTVMLYNRLTGSQATAQRPLDSSPLESPNEQ
jgi:TM2 domain-containing membrane protein YozV